VGPWCQLRLWTVIGLQSVGGGAATLSLMFRTFVDRRQTLDAAEFGRDWGLAQLSPGMHVLSMAVLLGRGLAGWRGVLLATVGLMIPSALLTILLTGAYRWASRDLGWLDGPLWGLVPAVVGLATAVSIRQLWPLLREARAESRTALVTAVGVLVGSVAAFLLGLPVVAILLGGAGAAAVVAGLTVRRSEPAERG
jgi:chromate transporter